MGSYWNHAESYFFAQLQDKDTQMLELLVHPQTYQFKQKSLLDLIFKKSKSNYFENPQLAEALYANI